MLSAKSLATPKIEKHEDPAPPQLLQLEGRIVPTTFLVTSNADTATGGTLREAITLANTTAGNDIINFNFAPVTITLGSSALPTIINAADIVGAGTAGTVTITGSFTISGDNGDVNRNFNIFNIATGGNLSISGVTISGAQVTGNGGGFNNAGTLTVSNSILSDNIAFGNGSGGGISNSGTLTVSNSTISRNSSSNSGGGISNNGGTVTVSNSTISGNGTFGGGGGINNSQGGTLTVSNSTISRNASGSQAGGISNSGILIVSNSTLSDNTAPLGGGGISNFSGGTLTVTNSTLSGNTASNNGGGGILNAGTLTVSNSTLSGNSAPLFGAANDGGGIKNTGTLNIANTIIANSTGGGDFAGVAPTTNTNNIVENLGTVTGGTFTPAFTADPLLGPLQNNGGPTFTMALGVGSVAIGAGNAAISNATPILGKDQRGINRTTSDIGAYSFGIQVNTTADTVNPSDNFTSLREAIALANATPGDDQISFNLTGTNTITLLSAALPTIISASAAITGGTAGTVTITGLGASSLIISGNNGNANRDFNIFNIATGGNLSISGVTVSGAQFTGNGGAFNNAGTLTVSNSTISGNTAVTGGAIFNTGSLSVSNSTLSGNTASSSGGGIRNAGFGSVSVSNSTISNNTATNDGGGISNSSSGNVSVSNSTLSGNSAGNNGGGISHTGFVLTVTNSTISGNTANNDGGGIYNNNSLTVSNSTISGNKATTSNGGGIYNKNNNNNGRLTLSNSTLANNDAGNDGGGIKNTGTGTVSNSTLSGNTASFFGGGISNYSTLTVSNSTISGNTAAGGGGIINPGTLTVSNSTISGNAGGGILNRGGSSPTLGTLNIANTIIANSTKGDDFAGAVPTTNTNNLVETLGTVTGGTFTPAFTADPLLGPLQNNGGPTFTMALGAGSAAIGTGNATISNAAPILGKDQRGINRTTSDIGAYSFGIQVTTTLDTVNSTDGVISLREAIILANTTAGDDGISFNLTGNSPYTITLGSALPTIVDSGTAGALAITGLGASSLIISGNNGDVNRNFNIFNIGQGVILPSPA